VKHVVWNLEVDRLLKPDEVGVRLKDGHGSWLHGKRDSARETYARYISTWYTSQQAYPNEWD
jgi:hypothetical protein